MDNFRSATLGCIVKAFPFFLSFVLPIIFYDPNTLDYFKRALPVYYIAISVIILHFIYKTFASLYNFNDLSPVDKYFLEHDVKLPNIGMVGSMILSFYYAISLFALIYLHIGNTQPGSFSNEKVISYTEAIYFSLDNDDCRSVWS